MRVGVDGWVEVDGVSGREGVGSGWDAGSVGKGYGAEGFSLECSCFAKRGEKKVRLICLKYVYSCFFVSQMKY